MSAEFDEGGTALDARDVPDRFLKAGARRGQRQRVVIGRINRRPDIGVGRPRYREFEIIELPRDCLLYTSRCV